LNNKRKILIFFIFCAYSIIFYFRFILINETVNSNTIITKADIQRSKLTSNDKKTSQDGEHEEEQKIAYLTFDDGPSYVITNKLLDILSECNVKATFFVVGKEIKGKEKILRRIHEEGHSIGLHTYTHNFKSIYKSNDNFIHEMKKTSVMIQNIIGTKPTAIRFPGGSFGALNADLLELLHKNGFKVFDWNVNLGDGINAAAPPSKLLSNSYKAKGNQNVRFILAHCNYNNINTVRALKPIVEYYKKEGFKFMPIGNSTKEYHYKIKK
jgi:peptidoglycan-N-acetylglucosamine deacetylase